MRVDIHRWVTLALVLFVAPALAQTQADRLYVGYGVAGGGTLDAGRTRVDTRRQLDLRVPLPPIVLGRTYLLPSLGYELKWLGAQVPPPGLSGEGDDELGRRYHRIQLGLTLVRPIVPRWMVIAGVMGSTRTDFRSSFDLALDTSWVAFAMVNHQLGVEPGFSVTFGVVALWPFDLLPVLPMASVNYRRGPWILEVGLPRSTLLHKLGDTVELGLVAGFEQQVLRTRFEPEARIPGAFYLRETLIRVAPTVNVHLGQDVWLSTAVGLTLINDFALLDRQRDNLNLPGLGAGPAPYARVVLGWRPPLGRPKARATR
ncbi:hypothetical protein G4177_13850 [Corallococcus sp. ZKHCc1 1396]|uniref:Outer membrane protein beta-barrel domain-containing protein n=1 Tax=Corallococcus soli TaxID=2710757 RepID=A0ABR9PMU5_9BACT|nr:MULTISPECIES: DUF6268 family outer membrane beta-barrel protein [Corallococcus]MBE4749246.1 hypothetical protein [Corallococcus soli]MCY1033756.1 DUF6268 family outer membrane beta-barrel protein [Corallococcus sp. BB11-1]